MPTRSEFFCDDLLHHFKLQIPLGHQLLQPRILLLQALELDHLANFHPLEPPAPQIQRLLRYVVLARRRGHTVPSRFAQNLDDLLFRIPLLHLVPPSGYPKPDFGPKNRGHSTTRGKRIGFIRFVEIWKERNEEIGIVVLERFIDLPGAYLNQYVFALLDLAAARLYVYSEVDGQATVIRTSRFPYDA